MIFFTYNKNDADDDNNNNKIIEVITRTIADVYLSLQTAHCDFSD